MLRAAGWCREGARVKPRAVSAGTIVGFLLVVLSGFAVALPSGRASDTKLAKHAALSLSDFPAGWRTSSSSSSSSDAIASSIPECRTFEKVAKSIKSGSSARSGNRDFKQNSDSVSNNVSVFSTARLAKSALDAFSSSSVSPCLQKLLTASVAKSASSSSSLAKVKGVQVGRLSVDPIGDRSVAYQAVVTLQLGSLTPTVTADYELVQVGRATALFTFVGIDSDLRSTLLNDVVDRLQGGGSPPQATTTTSAPKGSALGATLKTPNGNSLTVYSYEQPATGLNQFLQPQQPNDEFAAIDVQGCAGTSAASLNPFDFNLQMPDNTRREPTYGKDPALHSTDLTPGDCVRGWVTFEVPAGTRATSVVYSARGSSLNPTILKWALA
jgi:hypothetical protein